MLVGGLSSCANHVSGNTASMIATGDTTRSSDTVIADIKATGIYERTYNQVSYNCMDFAWDTARALNADWISAKVLIITYTDGSQHAVDIIDTTDKGWIIVEPQSAQIIHPEVGKVDITYLPSFMSFGGMPIISNGIVRMQVMDYDRMSFVDLAQYIGDYSPRLKSGASRGLTPNAQSER